MPLNTYGVWKGKVTNVKIPDSSIIPGVRVFHACIDLQNDADHKPEATKAIINFRSGRYDTSRLVYWLIQDLETRHHLEALPRGWNEIIHLASPDHRRISLDYLRVAIDHLESGESVRDTDTIADYLCPFIMNASEKDATAYIYGQLDKGNSTIHDVHMNQGSEALFLAFVSQGSITNEDGQPKIPGLGRVVEYNNLATPVLHTHCPGISIIALLLSSNNDGKQEVFIRNMTSNDVDLTGCLLTDGQGLSNGIPQNTVLQPLGGCIRVRLPNYYFPRTGSIIFLKDALGKTVDVVSYTGERVQKAGSLLYFGRQLSRTLS
ncbi:hypothetical protein F53441_6 [Fusarium austroafricanum]|uniref:LTD domain-containing protein n=1 Tax=Fusarium austroafricanum TaxID=2364996 RepID=A0A8H4KVB5_9HYPO|nr:hypothetical protein F53441_6 [Fusarium austroafricanum]